MNVSILVYMHICIYMQYVYMCMCMYTHIHTYTQLHIHEHIHTYMETSHIHLHIHWHIHIRSYTYIYTYVTSHGSKRVSERCSIACVGKQLHIVFFYLCFFRFVRQSQRINGLSLEFESFFRCVLKIWKQDGWSMHLWSCIRDVKPVIAWSMHLWSCIGDVKPLIYWSMHLWYCFETVILNAFHELWMETLPPTMAKLSLGQFLFAVALASWVFGPSWISPESAPKSVPPSGLFHLNIIICPRHILVERATSTGFLVERGFVF